MSTHDGTPCSYRVISGTVPSSIEPSPKWGFSSELWTTGPLGATAKFAPAEAVPSGSAAGLSCRRTGLPVAGSICYGHPVVQAASGKPVEVRHWSATVGGEQGACQNSG